MSVPPQKPLALDTPPQLPPLPLPRRQPPGPTHSAHPARRVAMSLSGNKRPIESITDVDSSRNVQARYCNLDSRSVLTADATGSIPCPASRLYPHALESIFAFCSWPDLISTTSVCCSWRSATLSMRPLDFGFQLALPNHVSVYRRSALRRRHTAALSLTKGAATSNIINSIADWMSQLKKLRVTMEQPTDAALAIPAGLQELTLSLPAGFTPAAVNAVIEEIGRLRQLNRLVQILPSLDDAHCFAPLGRIPSLSTLELQCPHASVFTAQQIEQLRSISSLTSFAVWPWHRSVLDPRRLLAVPHQWQRLQSLKGHIGMNDESGPLLLHLPELTELQFAIGDSSCTHVGWLAQVPKLTTLGFAMVQQGSTDVPRVMTALQQCTGLTTLQLRGGKAVANNFFTVEQLDPLLQHLPHLRALSLNRMPQLRSLSFLSRGTIPQQLARLRLGRFAGALPADEVRHIISLRSLQELRIQHDVFDRRLDLFAVLRLTPPSLLMPALRDFVYAEKIYVYV